MDNEALRQQLRQLAVSLVGPDQDDAVSQFVGCFFGRRLNKGDAFARSGEKAGQLGFICRGVIRAYHLTRDGSEYTKTLFEENDFVAPLAALVTGEPGPVTLEALTPVDFLAADFADIETLFARHHVLERMGRKVVEWEWVKKERREIRLMTLSAQERYELFLSERPGLVDRIPLYIVAQFLGITPVALSRIRARIKMQGA